MRFIKLAGYAARLASGCVHLRRRPPSAVLAPAPVAVMLADAPAPAVLAVGLLEFGQLGSSCSRVCLPRSATCISVAVYERAVREQCLRAVLHSIKTQAWVMSEEECYDSIMWRMVRTTAAAAIVLESARTPAVLSPGRCSCGDCAQPAHSAHRLPLLLSPLFPPVQSFRMNFEVTSCGWMMKLRLA